MAGEKASGNTPSSTDFLSELRLEYQKADRFLREVEDFIDEAGIPGFNELRYAGYHLLQAIDDAGNLQNPADLTRAVNHAKRACYEAGEAGSLVALDGIRAFKQDYKFVRVSQVIADYPRMLGEAEKQRELMIDSRVADEDKARDYDARMEAFRALRDMLRTLEANRDECNALVAERRSESRRFLLMFVAAILGIIVTAVVGFTAT